MFLQVLRKDLMLTQVMPYCNQAPHTILKSNVKSFTSKKCESIKFPENDAFHLPSSDVKRSCDSDFIDSFLKINTHAPVFSQKDLLSSLRGN